jgi:hypothetical protein
MSQQQTLGVDCFEDFKIVLDSLLLLLKPPFQPQIIC